MRDGTAALIMYFASAGEMICFQLQEAKNIGMADAQVCDLATMIRTAGVFPRYISVDNSFFRV
jgi:hypothetical protein